MFTVSLPLDLEEYAAVIRSVRSGHMPHYAARDFFEEHGMSRHMDWIDNIQRLYTRYRRYPEWLWWELQYRGVSEELIPAMIFSRIEFHGNQRCNRLSQIYFYIDPKSTMSNPLWCVLPYYHNQQRLYHAGRRVTNEYS